MKQVFIGSSNESKDTACLVASWVEQVQGVKPICWYSHTTFKASKYTWDELYKLAHTVDAAIFVFSADDKTWYRGAKTKEPRDNVILEFGLFSGALRTENIMFIRKENAHLPTDLLGITYTDISAVNAAEMKVKEWCKDLNL